MKLIDSFLFSEVYEKELLLLKFILEDKGVHEWILLENAYSFQGEYTGLHARQLVTSDERFTPYLHKLTIISKEEKTKVLPRHRFLDEFSFKAEYMQRDFAYDYFMQKYENEDWIMVSDVDEIIDFTNNARRNELYSRMKSTPNGFLQVPTKRYWYDFDNEYKLLIGNAMCNKNYLLNTGKKLHHVRAENRKVLQKGWKNIVEFEYSSCYDAEYMLRKFYTSTHTGFTPNDLKQSLRCNHRPVREIENRKPKNDSRFFFETVALTQRNSPKHVRENLAFYKTNAIDKNYKKNRREDYPELFKLNYFVAEFVERKKKWFNKKLSAVKYKLKAIW